MDTQRTSLQTPTLTPVRLLLTLGFYGGSCGLRDLLTVIQLNRSKRHPSNTTRAALVSQIQVSLHFYTRSCSVKFSPQTRGHSELSTPISEKHLRFYWMSSTWEYRACYCRQNKSLLSVGCACCIAVLQPCHTSNLAKQSRRISSEPFPSTKLYYSWYFTFWFPADE